MWVNEMFDPNQPDTYFLGIAHGKTEINDNSWYKA